MNFSELKDTDYCFSVVLFIQAADVDAKKAQLEEIGNQKNVKLVVQPCPFEGIEFLYRIASELIGHVMSIDKDVFWQAIRLKKDTPEDTFERISKVHYEYLCAILQQDPGTVTTHTTKLSNLSDYFVAL